MTKTMTDATFGLDESKIAELNAVVDRAQAAAAAFRKLDQKAVDDIVLAMVVAGLDAAIDLAGVAMEETSFGVFEDKVIKNYLATEFLYDYLKDKKTVGVVDHDEEANIDYVAEPIGVVMAITPITNPTSTVLFKAIVAAKTRNAIIFRPSPHAERSAERTACGDGRKMIALRVLAATMALNSTVEVGLVIGVMAITTPIGSAT